jgi:putative transport protein
MSSIIELFVENHLLLLFTIIGLGYLLGTIKFFGFQLGVAAVLFVGITFGAMDKRLALPEYVYVIGLVLFVYAIGLQSGPGFFAALKKRGLRINLIAVSILGFAAIGTAMLGKLNGLSAPVIAGLYCGALTNTPALAATVETVKHLSANIPSELVELYMNSPVVTYGLAYPFGVLGIILWFFVFTKLFKIDFKKEEQERRKEFGADAIVSHTYSVINPAIIGKSIAKALKILGDPGFVLSRIKKGERIAIVAPEMVLDKNDQIVAVGTESALQRARVLFGEQSDEHLAERRDGISYRRIFVSNPSVAGMTIQELELERKFEAAITRIRRGDVDFVPSADTILELGDRIRVVTREDNLKRVAEFFGDSIKALSETDFLSLSLGIVLGVFVGMIPFPLPSGMTFKLGFAGGPLIVALILGRLHHTGPITWGMPFNANLVLRQIGMVFFLAGIGSKAGGGLGATFQNGGWLLIASGAMITTAVTVATILIGYKFLKLPMSAVMGMMSGMQTQPACLAYANQQAQNELPNVWYATVYPASMVAKIIIAQILVSMLLTF